MLGSKLRLSGAVLVAVVVITLAAACGGSGAKNERTSDSSSGIASNSSKSQAPSSTGGQAVVAATSASASSGGAAATTTSGWDRKIIRNADLTLQVNNVESFLAAVRSTVDGVGGIVFASSTSYDGDVQTATMTLDVPSDQFDQVVSNLRSQSGVKKVVTESISSQDVTDDYVDLQSQLTNLKATQARLTILMDKATALQDILTVQDELSKVEGQIEQTTGRINYLDKKTSYSRITLTLSPVGVAIETKSTSGFDLGKAVHDAWKASLDFTGGVLTALVKVGVFLWWFWPLAVIGGAVAMVRRQRRRTLTSTIETGA